MTISSANFQSKIFMKVHHDAAVLQFAIDDD